MDEYKKLKINGKEISYPNNFDMEREENIVSEITTMSGKKLMDYNGWTFAEKTFEWDFLTNDELTTLIYETDPANSQNNDRTFTIEFPDIITMSSYQGEGERSVRAIRKSSVKTYTRFRDYDGTIMWADVKLTVIFPDVNHLP